MKITNDKKTLKEVVIFEFPIVMLLGICIILLRETNPIVAVILTIIGIGLLIHGISRIFKRR